MLTQVKTRRNICTVTKIIIPLQRKTEMTPFETNKKTCENSSVGRAQPCQGWGRGFESRFSLNKENIKILTSVEAKQKLAKIAQLVEHNLAKVGVAGSSPVFRSKNNSSLYLADILSPGGGIGRHATLRG